MFKNISLKLNKMSGLIGDFEKKTIDLDNNYDSLTGF